MGASGSGKMTLLNCISTIDTVTSGKVLVEGKDITTLRGKQLSAFRREKLGFIFQDFNLLDTLAAYENTSLALSISGIKAKEAGRIAKFASDERLTFTDIRRYSGSIMELKKKAEQYIIDAMDWRVEFGNLTRKEIPEIPLDAIREAITNSFGHRMFDSGQSNEITIFKN